MNDNNMNNNNLDNNNMNNNEMNNENIDNNIMNQGKMNNFNMYGNDKGGENMNKDDINNKEFNSDPISSPNQNVEQDSQQNRQPWVQPVYQQYPQPELQPIYQQYGKQEHSYNQYQNPNTPKPAKKGFWKKTMAVALTLAIVTASTVGVTTVNRMNTELNSQAKLISTLSEQVSVQKDVMLQTQDLASKVEALNSTSSQANSSTNLAKTTLLSGSSVTDIAKIVGPSVVGLRMTVATSNRRFSTASQSSEGSGIIISSDGYIMTNYHVVSYADKKSGYSDATTLEVFLPDGRSAKGVFVGGDSENDLAVVKIDLKDLSVAELGASSDLQVGELAVAIGNPLGMEFAGSVTVGVVSALNRKIDGQESSLNLIQTDAAINPGNSGGALVNSKGQVVGINTVKISQTGVEGLGFAISIDDAKPIINSLIMYGYVKNRPYIGIAGQDVTEIMASMYSVPEGVYVTEVDSTGGGAKAGLKAGDIITGIAGKDITTMAELNSVKKGYKSGDTVNLNITRNTTKMTLKLTFTEAK